MLYEVITVEHDVFDFAVVGLGFETGEKLVAEVLLHRIDHRHPVAAANQVGVVGGAVGGAENDVEGAQGRIERADPVDAVGELDRITSYNVCYTKLLRFGSAIRVRPISTMRCWPPLSSPVICLRFSFSTGKRS